jgi:hypothetical protein
VAIEDAVASLLNENKLRVTAAADDAEAAILAVLCRPPFPTLTEVQIIGEIRKDPGNAGISDGAIHTALDSMSDPNVHTIRKNGDKYSCN